MPNGADRPQRPCTSGSDFWLVKAGRGRSWDTGTGKSASREEVYMKDIGPLVSLFTYSVLSCVERTAVLASVLVEQEVQGRRKADAREADGEFCFINMSSARAVCGKHRL